MAYSQVPLNFLALSLTIVMHVLAKGGDELKGYGALDDCEGVARGSGDVHLTCSLRTINSVFDTTNFSMIPVHDTTSLRIECDKVILSKSNLQDDDFAHLVNLRELVIDNCKLSKWPSGALTGLRDLRILSVRTKNTDWAAMSLEIAAGSFLPVRQLETLDITFNNIWSFPEGTFCPLTNLVNLNVSMNRLQDVSDLNFREMLAVPPQPLISHDGDNAPPPSPPPAPTVTPPCPLDIQVLDASYNHFVLLPAMGFAALRRLKELHINNNDISMVSLKALGGLKTLQIVDLSHNKIVTLPPELFADCKSSIKEIYLYNNSISVLAAGIFENLDQLLALDLSGNHLTSTWINTKTFKGLIRMVILNLAQNRLSKLEPEMFKDLFTMQILNLDDNMIETIPANTFAYTTNLHTLHISSNKVTYLDAYSLYAQYGLSTLTLTNNGLQGIHPDAFRNCSSLMELNLSDNSLTSVPIAIRDMISLETLDLGDNQITSIDKTSFVGLSNVYGIRLIGNKLEHLPNISFIGTPKLRILNLAMNKIKSIDKDTFVLTKSLEALRLDLNLLNDIDGIFNQSEGLVWLNVSANRLEKFDYYQIPRHLVWLDIANNSITQLENSKFLEYELELKTLDASFNKIEKIDALAIPGKIQLLFLNDNQINWVEAHTFLKKIHLTRVDLYANRITHMDLAALQLSPVDPALPLPEFYIGGNPFQCDCNMEWLQRINKLDHLRQHPTVMDLSSIYCKMVYNRERTYVPLLEADSSQFRCTYTTHCFTLCQCCDFDACDCEMTCPMNCTCYHDQSWSSNVVECSGAGYTEMPSSIPMDATELYLDGNNFGELSSHSFIGRKNLKVLFANNSNIAAIYNHTFSRLTRLTVLHLENNYIKELLGFELATLVSLKELYLQGNKIHYIDNRTFVELKSLEVLRLEGNRIYSLSVWQFTLNPYLVSIGLVENPWSCDCQYLRKFRDWLRGNTEKVIDYNKIVCVFNNITDAVGPPLADFESTTCSSFPLGGASQVESQVINDYLPLLSITVFAFALCVGLVCGLFYYRRELRVWIYSRCGLRMCYKTTVFEDEQDKERLFDAYISYSVKDEAFVGQMLAPRLEAGDPGYRLCLHYRDFNASAYVADTIIEAVESSKRTVVVLSKNFIHNEWCRFEFKSALHEVLKERRRRLIIILMGELPMRDLDPDLRLYLKTNTCIEWGDRQFWQKLRFSMPDLKKSCHHRRSTVNIYASVSPSVAERSRSPALPPPPPPGKLPPAFLHAQHPQHAQHGQHAHAPHAPVLGLSPMGGLAPLTLSAHRDPRLNLPQPLWA